MRTRVDNGVLLDIGFARVNAAMATFGPVSEISTLQRAFPWPEELRQGSLMEEAVSGTSARLTSLSGADVGDLVLIDVDLSDCAFDGARRLDQIRLEGRCTFMSERIKRSSTRRQMLAEEYRSRTRQPRSHIYSYGWVGPTRMASTYRSLRKALEDSKNEAAAGDFYYGEMEMRRRSSVTTWPEKAILSAYWLVSGYGQRALRPLMGMGVLIVVVSVLLGTVGLPDAVFGWPRIDQSVRIAMGAIVLRDAGQQLTSPGAWTVMVARFVGPVLLAMAVLAIRARVKR